jgi:hypothetical protein
MFSSGPNVSNGSQTGLPLNGQIKGWGRAKKEALIRSDWAAVSRLAQRRGGLLSKRHSE